MSDLLIAFADNLVAKLAGAFMMATVAGRPLQVKVEWSADVNAELTDKDLLAPLVWVLDAGDLVETERGDCHEDMDLLVIVQMNRQTDLDDNELARDMSSLAAAIKDFCKTRDASATLSVNEGADEVNCIRAARPMARNHDSWHHERRFFTEILTTWRRY